MIVEDPEIAGIFSTFQEDDMLFIYLSDPAYAFVIVFDKQRDIFMLDRRRNGFVDQVIAGYDPTAAEPTHDLLPEDDLPLSGFLIQKNGRIFAKEAVAGCTIVAADHTVHIQDGIDVVLFTPVNDICETSKTLFVEVDARLFIQESIRVEDDPDAVVAHVRHQLDVFFPKMILFPTVPERIKVFLAAEFTDLLGYEAAGSPALRIVVFSRSGEKNEFKIISGQRGRSDHESFYVLPVGSSPSGQDQFLTVFVYKSDPISLQDAFYSLIVQFAHNILLTSKIPVRLLEKRQGQLMLPPPSV